eukprot:1981565-Pyramimonas_sp.AAC.1
MFKLTWVLVSELPTREFCVVHNGQSPSLLGNASQLLAVTDTISSDPRGGWDTRCAREASSVMFTV